MLNALFFALAVAVLFAGCAALVVDVLISLSTDRCRVPVPAEYVAKPAGDRSEVNRPSGLFVLAVPEFTYAFEGRRYRGKSATVFFNPVKPTVFVTAGEQRLTFLRMVGIAVVVLGMALLWWAMHLPPLS